MYTEVKSFYSRNVGLDEGDLKTVVEKATEKANKYLEEQEAANLVVKVVSSSSQLAIEGNYAAYVITLVLELTHVEENEEWD